MYAVIWLLLTLIHIFEWAVIIYIIIGLGIAFNIINPYQPVVRKINHALAQLVEPVLKPIRNVIPPLGSIDVSPMVLLLALGFVERLIVSL